MSNCDNFFRDLGIGFTPDLQDTAVYAVRRQPGYDRSYKKWLILCWFDTTYGHWNGSRFDMGVSRSLMSDFLKHTGYDSFETFLDDTPESEVKPNDTSA